MGVKNNVKNKKGFTLLELMIVIAIISILVMVLIPNFVGARNAAKLTSCKSRIKNISIVLEIYSQDNNGVYPNVNIDEIKMSGNPLAAYIGKEYKCPVANKYYEYKENSSNYYIYCPTYSTSLKHKNRTTIITKLAFSPKEGFITQY